MFFWLRVRHGSSERRPDWFLRGAQNDKNAGRLCLCSAGAAKGERGAHLLELFGGESGNPAELVERGERPGGDDLAREVRPDDGDGGEGSFGGGVEVGLRRSAVAAGGLNRIRTSETLLFPRGLAEFLFFGRGADDGDGADLLELLGGNAADAVEVVEAGEGAGGKDERRELRTDGGSGFQGFAVRGVELDGGAGRRGTGSLGALLVGDGGERGGGEQRDEKEWLEGVHGGCLGLLDRWKRERWRGGRNVGCQPGRFGSLSRACAAPAVTYPAMPAFALTIFTGAFLLFQVQPLIGKYILPWFGGSPGVWTTCMLFFQMLLLGGYAYAHAISRKLTPRTQAVVHLALLALALVTLPITPNDAWKPKVSGDPTGHILLLLLVTLGLPYLVLAATGPLMQEWFRRTAPGVSPYRLYALSNVGSLLALVSYPFFFETQFTRQTQASFWSWGMVFYAACAAFCAWRVRKTAPVETEEKAAQAGADLAPKPTAAQWLLWLCLPACASILLLAVTNKMCQDVAPTPFLWVLPLALYLLSFIISFDGPRWYSRFYYTIALVGAVAAVCIALFEGPDMAITRQIVVYSTMLFVGCMICHGELYQLRPAPRHLTAFYLMISAGGAVGGLFVALVAPAIFSNYYEIHLSVALTVVLLIVISWRGKAALSPLRWEILFWVLFAVGAYGAGVRWHRGVWVAAAVVGLALAVLRWRGRNFNWHAMTCGWLLGGLSALVTALGLQIRDARKGSLMSARNFYGVLSVFEYEKERPESHYYLLLHGRITHGLQFVSPSRAREITSYFGPTSGLGLAFNHFPKREGKRIGLLGLGVGTIAAYGRPGDYMRIYEINPQVTDIAAKPFSYLANSEAKVEVVMGDGRLSMENEAPQNFDILIMDAFSSDAVPVHLLTREAFDIYVRHLNKDGAILVNISNRFLDLRPVVENAAKEFGFQALHINSDDGGGEEEGESAWWLYGSSWMILSKNTEFLNRGALRQAASPPLSEPNKIPLWTDDYASMFEILHRQ